MDEPKFDVFLSHSSDDKPIVRGVCNALVKRGLSVWLDENELRPGLPWQGDLETIVGSCKAAMACVGATGWGPWEHMEVNALIRRFVKERSTGGILPIIPVLLPKAPPELKLPTFLEEYTWVDLRQGITADAIAKLQWGITGRKPGEKRPTVCLAKVTPDLRKSRKELADYLTSARVTVLPAEPYPSDAVGLINGLESDLKQADLFVQILGEVDSDRTSGFPKGEERAQLELAERLGTTVLQWRGRSVRLEAIDDEGHRELVGGPNVVCNDLAEFGKLVVEKAQQVHEASGQAAGPDKQWLALIKADNKKDNHLVEKVCDALTSSQVKCLTPLSRKSMMDWFRHEPYDAVVVVHCQGSEDLFEQHGSELMAVDNDLKDLAPVRAYYTCTEEVYLPYRAKGLLKVKHEDADGLKQLMSAIQQRGGRP